VRRSLLTPGSASAGPVHAHAFDAGADAYGQFVEGAAVMLIFRGSSAASGAGLLLSLWREDGLPDGLARVPGRAGGGRLRRGAGGARWSRWSSWAWASSLSGLRRRSAAGGAEGRLALGLAALAGVFAMMTAFEGHGLFELPVFTHLGLLFGANLATALAAGVFNLA
jgi:hypothetical protein